jgi:hypothetical protein
MIDTIYSVNGTPNCGDNPDGTVYCPPPPPPTPPVTYTMTFGRVNLATVKSSLGKVYGQDPALYGTDCMRTSESEDYIAFGGDYDSISKFYGSGDLYISDSDDKTIWYTEGSRLTLVRLVCGGYDYSARWDVDVCVSYSVTKTVSLEYILANGNLRLRPAGSTGAYDVWTPYSYHYYMYKSKATAKSKEARRFFKISK